LTAHISVVTTRIRCESLYWNVSLVVIRSIGAESPGEPSTPQG
jgi:hypothetical protein